VDWLGAKDAYRSSPWIISPMIRIIVVGSSRIGCASGLSITLEFNSTSAREERKAFVYSIDDANGFVIVRFAN
jgi:hypothetical protein